MFGPMAVWFLIGLLVFLLLAPRFFAHQAERSLGGVVSGAMLMVFTLILIGRASRGFLVRFLDHFRSVQRAEMWGVVLALQSSRAVHLGVDNLGVVSHVGLLLRRLSWS